MPSGFAMRDTPSRYQPLIDYLAACEQDEAVFTFKEIAAMIGRRSLPEPAILSTAWWTYGKNPHVQRWRAIGWRAHSDRDNLRVRFTRDAEEG